MKPCTKCGIEKPLSSYEKLPSGNYRGYCHRCRKGQPPLAAPAQQEVPKFARELKSSRFLITSAQNNTMAHAGFLECLKVAARFYGAELVVIPFRYQNPTGIRPGTDMRKCLKKGCKRRRNHKGECSPLPDPANELWWDPALDQYLHNERAELNENLVLAADVKINPTAMKPLSGFEALTGARSCIIGHPKMQYKAVASGDWPKILTTTGAVTDRDSYSNTKAGAIGEFHHYLGALIVELEEVPDEHDPKNVQQLFYIRQLNASRRDGSFTDASCHGLRVFKREGVFKAPSAASITLGDSHARSADPKVDRATFGEGGIVETVDPEYLVYHDLNDGETHNHHERHDPIIRMARGAAGRLGVRSELVDTVHYANERTRGRKGIVVFSNHHAFLKKWIDDSDWKSMSKENAVFYLELARVMAASAEMKGNDPTYVDPFAYAMKSLGLESNIRVLAADESFKVHGIEHGWHGHWGPNGAKGTVANLSRVGTKVNSGHGHSPEICEGHYRSGTSTPRHQHYHRGPGSNLNTHIVTYATGARALLTVIGDRWCAGLTITNRKRKTG